MSENTSYKTLFQVEDKVFKGLMIFNVIRMCLSIAMTTMSIQSVLYLMANGYLFYGLLSLVSIVLCFGIVLTTIGLKKETVLLQMILMGLTVLMICSNVALGGGLQIPFMDAAMTYIIVKNKHFFMN